MTKSLWSVPVRALARSALMVAVVCLGALSPAVAAGPPSPQNGPQNGPKIWLGDSQTLPVHLAGASALAPAQPVSMAQGDFDQDGIADLAVGYRAGGTGFIAIHRGNLDAFAPQSEESFQAIGRGEFPAPFLPEAQTFSVPVIPDFIGAGNFTGSGHTDLIVAARGGNALYVLAGDGKGNFAAPRAVNLPGGVTALAVGDFGSPYQPTLVVGISLSKTNALLVYGRSQQGLKQLASYSLSAPASNILFGDFGDPGGDIAFLAGGQIQILRSSTMRVVPVSLASSARVFALGSFIYDRNGGPQIALLASDGSVQIAVRNEFDPRVYTVAEVNAIRQAKINHQPTPSFVPVPSFPANGWKIVEGFPMGTVNPAQSPVFFRTRVSSNGADDIMWLNADNGQMAVISHPDLHPGASTFLPGQLSIRSYYGSPLNALPMRINVDGRPGVVAIHQGEVAPSLLMPLPDPTFVVNRFDDPLPASPITNACNTPASTDCSLREAVLRANALAGTDTIQLAAGTYTLTRGRITTPLYDAHDGTLNINDSVNIVGAAQNSTIITWGALTSGNSVDMVISVNEDIGTTTTATASISNLTIQNGVNNGTHSNDGDGGCMEFDTGTNGTANLTLTNVTIQNCATTQGGGGGLVIFNFVSPSGLGSATISNSIFQGNSAVDNPSAGAGGGIAISQDAFMTMTNSQVLNNNATQTASGQHGIGGGIVIFSPQNVSGPSARTSIHNSTISGNKAAGFGGGISNTADLVIDQDSIISNNTAGTDGTNPIAGQEGGGLYLNTLPSGGCPLGSTCQTGLNKVTIIGNTASANGGGISLGNNSGAGPLTMSFSRLTGNTAAAGSNLYNNDSAATVTNNWWGTNSPSSTISSVHNAPGPVPQPPSIPSSFSLIPPTRAL